MQLSRSALRDACRTGWRMQVAAAPAALGLVAQLKKAMKRAVTNLVIDMVRPTSQLRPGPALLRPGGMESAGK